MRKADLATIIRILIVIAIAYLVILKFNPYILVLLFAVALVLDAADGYLAVREASGGKIGVIDYIYASTGDEKLKKDVRDAKAKAGASAPYGPRLDVICDRIIEYTFWILFLYLHLIPLFVVLIVVARHSFADGLMGSKGTSSKMKTRFAQILYSSSASRALANILKFLAFSYLILEYVSGYHALFGDILVGILVAFIVARGAAEVYENTRA